MEAFKRDVIKFNDKCDIRLSSNSKRHKRFQVGQASFPGDERVT